MNSLVVELVVTEACNLGCKYCYMENRAQFMTLDTLQNFLQHIPTMMRVYNKDSYSIAYFGGEPLLNWNLIADALPLFHADEQCASQMVISNGLLLDEEKLSTLRAYGCGLSLSFDGLWNDLSRPLRGGLPSLPHYFSKMDFFRKHGLTSCKVMVSPDVVSTMTQNYTYLIDLGFTSPDFSLVRDDVWSWEDVSTFKEELPHLTDAVIRQFEQGHSYIAGFYHLMLADIFLAKHLGKRPQGCFSGCSGVGFLPDGVFYPCARYGSERAFPLLDTQEESPKLRMSNISFLKNPTISDPRAYAGCMNCPIRPYCNGGCNKSLLQYGCMKVAQPIPQVCDLYRSIFDETLRLHKALKGVTAYTAYLCQSIYPYLNGGN